MLLLPFLTLLLRQFKTSNDVPAPYSPDTKVLQGINSYKSIETFNYLLTQMELCKIFTTNNIS